MSLSRIAIAPLLQAVAVHNSHAWSCSPQHNGLTSIARIATESAAWQTCDTTRSHHHHFQTAMRAARYRLQADILATPREQWPFVYLPFDTRRRLL